MKYWKYSIILIYLFAGIINNSTAQNKYWVFFTDKKGVEFNPYEYFDTKAIERRLKNNIPLVEESDKPVNENYISQTALLCDSISYATRWFNALAVYSDEERIIKIKNLPFVLKIEEMETTIPIVAGDEFESKEGLKKLLLAQTERMGGNAFSQMNLSGKGIIIAIIDGGFKGFDGLEREKYFSHVKIKSTYDFLSKSENVYRKADHGKTVLSCIAGKVDGINIGFAPDAEFLLARTAKNFSVGGKDEEAFLAAVEWCDKNGADIINTSLGYDQTQYFQKDMDGKTSLIARSANLASQKGILVVVAAGNEGIYDWKKICTPADADSVLTVGAINPYSGLHCSWSSYGPSADFRMKPEISAYGNVAAVYQNGINEMMGTSFASPLVAGFAACVMQLHPDWSNMKVKEEIMRSADLFPYYDYAHGHGVPQANYFTENFQKTKKETFIIEKDSVTSYIDVIIKDEFYQYNVPFIMNYDYIKGLQEGDLEELAPTSLHINDFEMSYLSSTLYTALPSYLFYHIENPEGYLEKYFVVAIENKKVASVDISTFPSKTKIRFYYKGDIQTYEVK